MKPRASEPPSVGGGARTARPKPAKAASRAHAALTHEQLEALTVAMIVAPGVYVRNRMFELFASPGARRARMRSATVRGVAAQLARAAAVSITADERGDARWFVLRYEISAVKLTRVVALSAAELAALRLVAARANVRTIVPEPGDRQIVTQALGRLLESSLATGEASSDVLMLARDITSPPPALTD